MAYAPLIRFRYAMKKAGEAGVRAVAPRTPSAPAVPLSPKPAAHRTRKIPAPPGVVRTSIRIDEAPKRASLSEEEMTAIMVLFRHNTPKYVCNNLFYRYRS